MLEEVRGDIRRIIVKDFSRFDWNYFDIGNYLEQIFTFLGNCFIFINNHFDSNDIKVTTTGGFDVCFKIF